MKNGGIFNSPSALGALGGDATSMNCTNTNNASFVKMVQTALRVNGASQLKADGIWGPCSQAAFETVTGQKFSKASVENLLQGSVTCKTFGYVPSSGICSNGTDAVDAKAETVDSGYTTPATYVPNTTTPAKTGTTTTKVAAAAAGKTIIPGVPNVALAVGGLVFVAGALAIVASKKG